MDDNAKVETPEDSPETSADNVETVEDPSGDNVDSVETVSLTAEQSEAIVNGITLQSFAMCAILGILCIGLFFKGADK